MANLLQRARKAVTNPLSTIVAPFSGATKESRQILGGAALVGGGMLAAPALGIGGAGASIGAGGAGGAGMAGYAIPGAILGSSLLGAYSANKGAEAQSDAARRATAEERRQFDITQANMAPWLEAGKTGLNRLSDLVGGDMSGFYTDPGYQFAQEEGQKAIERSAAARGGLKSGGTLKDLTRFGQGLANQQYSDYWNRLAGLSNVGQTTGTTLGGLGANMAGNIGQNMMAGGQARASGYQGMANAAQGGINNALFYSMMQPQGGGGYNTSSLGTTSGFNAAASPYGIFAR